MKLFFDTETTGKADLKSAPDAAHQPRLVQLAALLTDDAGEELSSLNLIVKPEGFTIPEGASSIHGITTEHALKSGVGCKNARRLFKELWNLADLVIGHNLDFDLFVMDGEFYRAACGVVSWGKVNETFCTMKTMTDICKLPGPYGFKWPKLQEAHKHAFGSEFEGAHDALSDVRACAKVYFWLKNQPKP